ncbi:sensor histidine kinase [Actinomycetospora soli]|uniref:sensor histidine kinase n=1 Tax=Actinomycetospora soli TaxID=2893887 RepID=UPI001E333AEC|nr:sensor histidine kinase [Actinomycetospora soli]MCD2191762.1 sensor histidine kinase [Actinomycetospora soli]
MTLAADPGRGLARSLAVAPTFGRAAALAALAAVGAAALMAPLARYDPFTFAVNVAVAGCVALAGFVLARDPDHRTTGRILVLVAALWSLSWVNEWQVGPLPFLAEVLGPAWFVAGSAALLRYPQSGLSRRTETTFLAVFGLWACGGAAVCALTADPSWQGLPPGVFWPHFDAAETTHDSLSTAWFAGLGILLAALLALLAVKLVRVRGLGRSEAAPAAAMTACVAGAGIVFTVVHLVPMSEQTHELVLTMIAVAVLTIPLSFLVTAVRTHMARAAVADLVLRLTAAPSMPSIRDAMATALRDPSLELFFWLAPESRYLTEDNTPAPPTDASEDRWAIEIADVEGKPLAMMLTDPALRRHRGLVSAAIGASGLALSNGRLHQQVKAQLDEVHASRQRIVAAALQERRRIERDLHDGAQQSLLAVSATLSAVRLQVEDRPAAAAVVARAQTDLTHALRDLRDLARGLHPAVLTDQGLGPALERVAQGLGQPTDVDVPERRLGPEVESAAYFVGAEALTNIARHAQATRAAVTVTLTNGIVRLEVNDDGRGGADPAAGSGLRGLDDRLRALGGTLTIYDRPSGGTTLVATLPCR